MTRITTKRHPQYILLCILAFALLFSCRTKQPVISSKAYDKKTVSLDKEIDNIANKQYAFETLAARTNIELWDKKKNKSLLKSPAQIRMEKGKSIQISIHPFVGIEVARIIIVSDTIQFIDRFKKQYIRESFSQVTKRQAPLNIENIQALLLGHLFVPNKQALSPELFTLTPLKSSSSLLEITTADKTSLIKPQFGIDGNHHLIHTELLSSKDESQHPIRATYSQYTTQDSIQYPTYTTIELQMDMFELELRVHFSHIDLNQPVRITTSPPNNYQKVELNDIL